MFREPKRPGYWKKGYRYWAIPLRPLPKVAIEQARLMNDMWNRLVEANNEQLEKRNEFARSYDDSILELEKKIADASELYSGILSDFKLAKMRQWDTVSSLDESLKDIKKHRDSLWQQLKTKRNEVTGKYKYKEDIKFYVIMNNIKKTYKDIYGLYGGCVELIYDSFKNARDQALDPKKKRKKRMPKFKQNSGMAFKVRYGDAGKPFNRVTKKHQYRTIFWIEPPKPDGKTTFYWKFGDKVIPFYTIIHRPIPDDFFIKSVQVQQDLATLKWTLVFAVEQPPIKKPHGDKTLFFYPRWTVDCLNPNQNIFEKEGDIIIGYLRKEGQEFAEKIKLFETIDYHPDKAKKSILSRIARIEETQRRADNQIEGIKRAIDPLAFKLEEWGWKGKIHLCRINGIMEIKRLFQENMPDHEINLFLSKGVEIYSRFMAEKNGIDRRLRRFRDWCYWNFANWLVKQADTLYLEQLDFKKMGAKKNIEPLPEEVASKIRKYKNIVAHHDLYSKIKSKCEEYGVTIIEIERSKDDGCSSSEDSTLILKEGC